MDTNTILLFLLLVSNILTFIWKAYLTQKGKNLATKEDVEEITQKIESVKINLGHLQSQKSEFLNNRKLALVNFFEEYITWSEYSVNNLTVTITQVFETSAIRNQIELLSNQYSKVQKSYWKLCLYESDDKNFIAEISAVYNASNRLHQITLNYMLQAEIISLRISYEVSNKELMSEFKQNIEKFAAERAKEEKAIKDNPSKLMSIIRLKLLKLYN